MNSDLEAKIIEARGPIILVVLPNMKYAKVLSMNLRQQYKDLAKGSQYHLRIWPTREVYLISARSHAMRGMRADDLFIHPQVQDEPNFESVLASCLPCLSPQVHWTHR